MSAVTEARDAHDRDEVVVQREVKNARVFAENERARNFLIEKLTLHLLTNDLEFAEIRVIHVLKVLAFRHVLVRSPNGTEVTRRAHGRRGVILFVVFRVARLDTRRLQHHSEPEDKLDARAKVVCRPLEVLGQLRLVRFLVESSSHVEWELADQVSRQLRRVGDDLKVAMADDRHVSLFELLHSRV